MNLLCASILLILSAVTQVLCQTKVLCGLQDDECIAEAVKTAFSAVVSGHPDFGMPTLEPVHVGLIEATTPTLNYTLSDTYLYGMKDCYPEKLKFDLNKLSWYFYIICPRLEVKSNYYISGSIDNINLEGEGKCTITYEDYHIAILSKYEKYLDTEGKDHIKTVSFVLDNLDVQGEIEYKFENLFYGDSIKSDSAHKFVNKNGQKLDAVIKKPMMNLFMGKFVDNTNIYSKAISISNMFFKIVKK